MKFDELRSIGHNIADSLASGIGLLIGVYEMDVFGEAARSPEGFISVDFLTGETAGGTPSPYLARAIKFYRQALAGLCQRHDASPALFRELTARYSSDYYGWHFVVTVEDHRGRRSVDEYEGPSGQRAKRLDQLGRIRPKSPRRFTPP
jgi:hypothetical protein